MERVNDFTFLYMALMGSPSKTRSSDVSQCFVISNFSHGPPDGRVVRSVRLSIQSWTSDLGSATNSVGIVTMSHVLLEYGFTHQ